MRLHDHSRGSEPGSQTFCPNVSPPLTGLGAVASDRLLAAESSIWGMAIPTPYASAYPESASALP